MICLDYDVYHWISEHVLVYMPFAAAFVTKKDDEETVESAGDETHNRSRKRQGLFETMKGTGSAEESVWQERKDAEDMLTRYLNDLPCKSSPVAATRHVLNDLSATVAFLHGPQGSGKHHMLMTAIEGTGR
jgi:CDP-glycerol glycerophosphotransferase (TagB/SpsB family)